MTPILLLFGLVLVIALIRSHSNILANFGGAMAGTKVLP